MIHVEADNGVHVINCSFMTIDRHSGEPRYDGSSDETGSRAERMKAFERSVAEARQRFVDYFERFKHRLPDLTLDLNQDVFFPVVYVSGSVDSVDAFAEEAIRYKPLVKTVQEESLFVLPDAHHTVP